MKLLRSLALSVLLLSQSAQAYWFENLRWPNGYVWFWLQLTPSQFRLGPRTPTFPLWDSASSFDASFRDAMDEWNIYTRDIQFAAIDFNSIYGSSGDGVNHVWFGYGEAGQAFTPDTLAVTEIYSFSGTNRFAETDITFNANQWWESYFGPLPPFAVIDFHRVALHELGHALGLDHPDQHGQNVVAIMNSTISNLDHLVPDDIAGAVQLYGARP